jgi:hypothetical protein
VTIKAMTEITKLVVDARVDDLRRDVERAATRAAALRARRRNAITDFPITIRRATESDEAALTRLAALDSAPVPASPVLLAESNGELRAALSLDHGAAVADPFHPTAAIVELLMALAAQDPSGRGALSRFRRRRRMRTRSARGRRNQATALPI